MYEQIMVLLSFVYAIALTHLLSSATDLILARDRVRFSSLLALWMVIALLGVLVNWLSIYGLSALKHFTPADVAFSFLIAVIQYFTCSLLSMRAPEHGAIDMPGFFEKQRRVIMAMNAALYTAAMIANYFYPQGSGVSANAWVQMDAVLLATVAFVAVAAFARHLWLQWLAVLANLAMALIFLLQFTMAG